jgi:hypothetical protein
MTLADITDLAYTFKYNSRDDNRLATPYLRVFLNDGTADVLYDPNECGSATPTEGVFHTIDVMQQTTLRYTDDACDHNDTKTWSELVAAHGSEEISGINVTTGFAGGQMVTATVQSMTINDQTFDFGG